MPENNTYSDLFPIVGIGASAGGLNAFESFIGELPEGFGFTVVFIQHLSAKHKSLLVDLIKKRRPDIDAIEISEGLKLLPGKIYISPAGKEVAIQRNTFHVKPLSAEHVYSQIDEFFMSLAKEAQERAIAVVFSGSGMDGARGTQALKNAGGSIFVQSPETAEFPSMPLAAIRTSQVDGILPPAAIALEILKLQDAVPAIGEKDISAGQLEDIFRLVKEKTGHRFNHYKKSVVGRRVRRRLYLRGILSVQDYIRLLSENDSETAGLASDLMIGVTSFFRDRLAWKALKIEVITKMAAEEDDHAVRVWTPACATGEEAFSIAMMLRHEFDLAGRKREIQVFATDVNEEALEKARAGRYMGTIAADIPPEYIKKFFTFEEDGSAVINKELRESVVFAKQDVLTDPPFSRLNLIICRNLLIYLEPDAQEKCIALFHYALGDGGYLFLGNAETPGGKSALFRSLAHKKCRIYQKAETTQLGRLSLAVPFSSSEKLRAAPLHPSVDHQQNVTEFIQQALLEKSGPPAVAVNQHLDIIYNNGPTNRYLSLPRGVPTYNLLDLLPQNLGVRIRGSLYRASQEARTVSLRVVIPNDDGKKRQVYLRISKLRDNLFLIIFHEKRAVAEEADVAAAETSVDENALRQLESELAASRAELQSNIEQLKSMNEELQSSNEELQAANEELETSSEELQSLNEELITVNSQLQSKIEEQEETNNDLTNFLSSTNIPTVFLDHQFRVRRFTVAMSRLVKLIPSDIGRPIADLSQENLGQELLVDARAVLESLVPAMREIAIRENWYIRSTLPYRTADNRIEGIVVTYNDITELKNAEEELRHRNEELTRFNKAAIGREMRMIELKKEVNELCARAGFVQRYNLDFVDEEPNDGRDVFEV